MNETGAEKWVPEAIAEQEAYLDRQLAERVMAELQQHGHSTELIKDAGTAGPYFNVWLTDGNRRHADQSVLIVKGEAEWGGNWEHKATGTSKAIASAILATGSVWDNR